LGNSTWEKLKKPTQGARLPEIKQGAPGLAMAA
jgi:hypothetical protein